MQSGSLVECIEHSTGMLKVNGVYIKALGDITVGTICTVDHVGPSTFDGKPVLGIILREDPEIYHPVT